MNFRVDLDANVDIRTIRHVYPDIPAGTIRRWASEGKLKRQGSDGRRTLYRVGDVLRLARERAS